MTQFENICRKTDSEFGFTYYMVKHPKWYGFTDTIEIDGSRGQWVAKTWKGLGRLDQQRLRRQADEYEVKLTDVSDDFTVVSGEVHPRMSIIAEAKTLKELDAKLTGEVVRKVIEDGNVFYHYMMEKLDPAFGGGIYKSDKKMSAALEVANSMKRVEDEQLAASHCVGEVTAIADQLNGMIEDGSLGFTKDDERIEAYYQKLDALEAASSKARRAIAKLQHSKSKVERQQRRLDAMKEGA